MKTQILPVNASNIGLLTSNPVEGDILDQLNIDLDLNGSDTQNIKVAAESLRSSDIPVAFPTETVYGLGADATRSAAVKGIFKAKQRPSDNPLIVHFASLAQLRSLLSGRSSTHQPHHADDPIPEIYKPLITRFWPGPLTIILSNPANSALAPEVTAGLSTFGARMPKHPLALALIQLADVPIAAPSANASTKPSPTAAEHVASDLNGRIETIIDGGPCDVGVESTVVDGLATPPVILRPGGISLEQLRSCPGWENTQIGYQNVAEKGSQPRAPGMKYRHYSPKATVILYEDKKEPPTISDLQKHVGANGRIGVIRTKTWALQSEGNLLLARKARTESVSNGNSSHVNGSTAQAGFAKMLQEMKASTAPQSTLIQRSARTASHNLELFDINLGSESANIARGIFSALRDLDRENVDAVFVEGINEYEGDTAAAIMNRLRKAAEVRVEG